MFVSGLLHFVYNSKRARDNLYNLLVYSVVVVDVRLRLARELERGGPNSRFESGLFRRGPSTSCLTSGSSLIVGRCRVSGVVLRLITCTNVGVDAAELDAEGEGIRDDTRSGDAITRRARLLGGARGSSLAILDVPLTKRVEVHDEASSLE